MTLRVRFAPSPTGWLHLGNIRTAVINWMHARQAGGEFLLRIDDTDVERSTEEFRQGIEEDMTWLGLTWDAYAKQSDRFADYDAARDGLMASGRLYACYETGPELELMRKTASIQGKPFIYNRATYPLSAEDEAAFKAEGRQAHWRFALKPGEIKWDDLARGETSFMAENLSDPVLIRGDGSYLYTLCSVLDDIDLGMTDIIRGEDHTSNTATQIQLFDALAEMKGLSDFQMPRFAHMPLVSGADGSKLSKSNGALSIRDLREEGGLEPLTIVAFLSRLGTPSGPQPVSDIGELAAGFGIERFGRSGPRMDPEELAPLNGKIVRQLPFSAVTDRFSGMTEAQWAAIQPNLEKLGDVNDWLSLIDGPVTPEIEDAAFTAQAAALLPEGPLDGDSWKAWTDAVKDATGAKGKTLFMPLRLALTGQPRGPEMAVLLPLIDRAKIIARLNGQTA